MVRRHHRHRHHQSLYDYNNNNNKNYKSHNHYNNDKNYNNYQHHHHAGNRQLQSMAITAATTTVTRSLALRVLSTLAVVLPAVLLVVSFSLALATIYSPHWAVQDILDQDGNRTRFHNYRAPFYDCNQTAVITDDIEVDGPNTTCRRINGLGGAGMSHCEALDPNDDHVCQQTVLAANLLVAGVVFIALAMAVSFGVIGTDIRAAMAETMTTTTNNTTGPSTSSSSSAAANANHDKHDGGVGETSAATTTGDDDEEAGGGGRGGGRGGGGLALAPVQQTVSWTEALDSALILLGLTGSGMLLLAQVVGVNALVNDVLPNANFEEFQANTPGSSLTYTSWYMGQASYVFISVAWLAGFLACYIARFVS